MLCNELFFYSVHTKFHRLSLDDIRHIVYININQPRRPGALRKIGGKRKMKKETTRLENLRKALMVEFYENINHNETLKEIRDEILAINAKLKAVKQ